MKTTISTLCVFVCTAAAGQTGNLVEQDLLRQFSRILYWRDHRDEQTLNGYDSLLEANRQFEKTLLTYSSRDPETIGFEFKSLRDQGLIISTSDDGLFRIYSWDTWTGGSMHFQQNVFQYKAGGSVFSEITREPLNHEGHYSTDRYIQVFTVKTRERTYYLGLFDRTCSSSDAYQGVKAFAVTGKILNDTVQLFETASGIENQLGFSYDFFSVVDRKERPIKLITYQRKRKKLKIPDVSDGGKVTDRYSTYQFTGRHFERKQ